MPFIVNKILLDTGSSIAGIMGLTVGEDTVFDRFLEYLFDINLGMGSFAMPVVLLFVASCIYDVVKRNYTMIMECAAGLFLLFLTSFSVNINCEMVSCTRYVVWIYPVVVFAAHKFPVQVFCGKNIIHCALSALCVLYTMVMFIYNGFYPIYRFNNFSSNILDRIPQLYVTFCDSTFNAKANGLYGGYNLIAQGGYAVYYDADRGEVRKNTLCEYRSCQG